MLNQEPLFSESFGNLPEGRFPEALSASSKTFLKPFTAQIYLPSAINFPWVSEDDWNLKKIIYFWLMIRLLLTAVNSTHLQLHAIREAFRVVCHYILQGDFVIVSNLWSTATLALRAILLIEVHVKWYIGQLPIPSDTVPVCSQIKKHSNITCLFLLSIGLTSKYSSTQSACLFVV